MWITDHDSNPNNFTFSSKTTSRNFLTKDKKKGKRDKGSAPTAPDGVSTPGKRKNRISWFGSTPKKGLGTATDDDGKPEEPGVAAPIPTISGFGEASAAELSTKWVGVTSCGEIGLDKLLPRYGRSLSNILRIGRRWCRWCRHQSPPRPRSL